MGPLHPDVEQYKSSRSDLPGYLLRQQSDQQFQSSRFYRSIAQVRDPSPDGGGANWKRGAFSEDQTWSTSPKKLGTEHLRHRKPTNPAKGVTGLAFPISPFSLTIPLSLPPPNENPVGRPNPAPATSNTRVGWIYTYLLKKEELVAELNKCRLDNTGTVEAHRSSRPRVSGYQLFFILQTDASDSGIEAVRSEAPAFSCHAGKP